MTSDCNYCEYQYTVQDGKIPIKCTLSHSEPCLACEQQVKLRKRIEETKKLLDALIIEEREARTHINAHHDPLQARQLPVEIVSNIFLFTLPPFTLQKPADFDHSGYPTEKPKCGRQAFILGAVCRAWRQTALSTPQLWTNIVFSLHREPTYQQSAIVEKWLERSKTLPLNIRLFLMDVDELAENRHEELRIPRWTFPEFIRLFNQHSVRWNTLSIQSPFSISRHFHGDQNAARCLTTLQLLNFMDDAGKFELQAPRMPLLSSVEASGYLRIEDLSISWNNVTHVTLTLLRFFSLDDYVQLLRNAPKLITLRLRRFRFLDIHNTPTPETPPIQHNLQNLEIVVGAPYTAVSFYSIIFDSITLPSLKELTLIGPKIGLDTNMGVLGSPFNRIIQFLERSSPPLESMDITIDMSGEHEALSLFSCLPKASMRYIRLNIQSRLGSGFKFANLAFNYFACGPIGADRMRPQLGLFPELVTFELVLNAPLCSIPWSRLPNIRHPLSGKDRPLKRIGIYLRYGLDSNSDPVLIVNENRTYIDESVIRGLIDLLDDGVELYLPGRVTHKHLLAMLEN